MADDGWRMTEVYVGNDIVDLGDPEARGKSRDRRFASRVLNETEHASYYASVGCDLSAGDALLWRLWSAKESAYKALQKAFGASPTPRSLEVVGDVSGLGSGAGEVAWRAHSVRVRWSSEAEYIHCVAWLSPNAVRDGSASVTARIARVEEPRMRAARLTASETISANNQASAAARLLAKDLIRERKSSASLDTLEILRQPASNGWAPPEICAGGRPLPDWDLSLSHHGRFAAAAVSYVG